MFYHILIFFINRAGDSNPAPWFLQINYPSPHEPVVLTRSMMDSFYNEKRVIDIKDPIGTPFMKSQFIRSKMDHITHWTKNDWINWLNSENNRTQFYKNIFKDSSITSHITNMFDSYLKYFLTSRNYALQIEMLDSYFGKWIKYLNESNLIDNTLICVASDHGDLLGYYNVFGKSKPYTGSIQVPLICMYTDGIRPNSNVVNNPVALMDIFGTFLDYAISGSDRYVPLIVLMIIHTKI